MPHLELPSAELLSRCFPSTLDLCVAFLSGVAAAYASGRPNLLSALPGVAIAAALVPPIATSGICAALGETSMALGALLLFFTNIVAIVLGTACSVWAVGIRGSHQHGPFSSWMHRVAFALIMLMCGLGIYEWLPNKLYVPPELTATLKGHVAERSGQVLHDVTIRWESHVPTLTLHVHASRPLQQNELIDLVPIIRNEFHEQAEVIVATHLVQTISHGRGTTDGTTN